MCIDQTRQRRAAVKVDDARALADQRTDIAVGPERENAIARNRDRLRDVESRVDRQNFSIDQNKRGGAHTFAGGRARPRIMSEAFSAIIMVGMLVLPPGSSGITEASTTRRLSIPRRRSCSSTTASAPTPILQV